MTKYQTLTEMLDHHSRGQLAIGYLEGENAEKTLPLSQLRRRALGILHHLQRLGAQPGDLLILHVAGNEPFLDAYWACIYGGIVPVPVAVGISDEHKHKLLRIARQLGEPLLYTERKLRDRLAAFAAEQGESGLWAAVEKRAFLIDQLDDISREGTPARLSPDQTAFVQFSSGSTSEPKGVVLTHRNLLTNMDGVVQAAAVNERDTTLSWMPLTHDMGLIGFHLMAMYGGARSYLMPTDLFVRRALLWAKFASEKRATITCSPNFGYRHFLRALGDRRLEGVDLSPVRLVFNGAEPISVDLADEFLERMAPYGLRRESMFPVYGLAEASLAVAFPPPGSGSRYLTVDRRSLGVGSEARHVAADEPGAVKLMCEGKPIAHTSVKLVDDAGAEVAPDRVGHVLIRGDNVTRGYFRNPEATAAAIDTEGWLRTGDLGLWHDGDLYITGRSKEIIFVNGQNYYPHDLEAVLQREPGLELGKVAVAGVRNPHSPTDDLCCSSRTAARCPGSCRSRRAPSTSSMSTQASRLHGSSPWLACRRPPAASSSAPPSRRPMRKESSLRSSRPSMRPGPPPTATGARRRAGSSSSSRPSWTTLCRASTWTWTRTCSRSAPARSRCSRSTRRSTSCIPASWSSRTSSISRPSASSRNTSSGSSPPVERT